MYTLTVTDHNDNVVMQLQYNVWSLAREAGELIARGTTKDYTYDVTITQTGLQKVLWSDCTF